MANVAWKVVDRKYRRLFSEDIYDDAEFTNTILDKSTTEAVAFPGVINIPDKYQYLFYKKTFEYEYKGEKREATSWIIPIISAVKVINNVNGLMIINPVAKLYDKIVGNLYSFIRFRDFNSDKYVSNHCKWIENQLRSHFQKLYLKYMQHPLKYSFSGVVCPSLKSNDTINVPFRIYKQMYIKPREVDYCLFWRNPVHDKDSMKIVKVSPIKGNTIKVPHSIWVPMKGDFDGDAGNGLFLLGKIVSLKKLFAKEKFENINYPKFPVDLKCKITKGFNKHECVEIEEYKNKYTAGIVGAGLRLLAFAESQDNNSVKPYIATEVISNIGQQALDFGHNDMQREGRKTEVLSIEDIDKFLVYLYNKKAIKDLSFLDNICLSKKVRSLLNIYNSSESNSLYGILDKEYPLYSLSRGRPIENLCLKKGRFFDDVLLRSINE